MWPDRENALATHAWQPVQLHREDVFEDQAQEEDRDRDADQRGDKARVVEPGGVALGCEETEWHTDEYGEQDGRQGELDRGRKAMADLVGDGARRGDAGPEVAVYGRVEVAPVLDIDRPIEAVLMADLGDRLRRCVLAEERLCG